ncbi:MAG: hypothetical protein Hens3KO_28980 [Henriciella sp.]
MSKTNLLSRRSTGLFAMAVSALALAACSPASAPVAEPEPTKKYTTADIQDILDDPVKRSEMIVKVMGTTAREDTYAFMKFHVYGYAGENLIPFFTMNNVIVQKWEPLEDPGYYAMKHYEVAYYSEFDSTTPIETWENPITGETNDIFPFVLGPIEREYTPEGVIAPGVAPNPLNISVIGNRVFIPTQSIDKIYNPMSTPDWGPYQGDPDVYWDSMLTFSADVEDVLNPDLASAPAEIHMQNLVSWNPFFKMGMRPGRTMVRAYGTDLESLDDIPPEARAGLEKYVPEIFDTDSWTELRLDAIDHMADVRARIDSGEIVVEPVSEDG